MRITAIIPTHHLPEESMPWLAEARTAFDEVIALIDEKRVTPGTVSRAEKAATRIIRNKGDIWYDPDRFSMLKACESDWIFILEYDEQLSQEWQQNRWRQILETTQFTHFYFPRRWTVPGGRYLHCEPWWPDFQLRLFRNNLEDFAFPEKLHEPLLAPGPGACFQNLAIHHHVLGLLSRAEREQKVRFYEQLRPGGGLGHFYLYEDYAPPDAPLPAEQLEGSHEIIRMEKLPAGKLENISLDVSGVPPEVKAGALFWPRARVINHTDEALYGVKPYPVRVAYHWREKATRKLVIFDGMRSGLFPGVAANATREFPMTILAPDEPGEYILEATMVQEGVRWFEDVHRGILQEFPISVRSRPEPVGLSGEEIALVEEGGTNS